MRLADEVWMYLRAACSGVFIQSIEDEMCTDELQYLCKRENMLLVVYDVDNGFLGTPLLTGNRAGIPPSPYFQSRLKLWADPVAGPSAALRDCGNIFKELHEEMKLWPEGVGLPEAQRPTVAVFLLRNYAKKDLLINSTLRTQIMQNLAIESKTSDPAFRIVIQSPHYELPPELERYFRLVEHKLPDREDIQKLAKEIDIPGISLNLTDEEWRPVVDAAVGLTSYEAGDAFAMSINRHRDDNTKPILDADFIWDQKATALRKQGLLEILDQPITFETLGGVDYLRDNCLTLLNYRDADPEMKPKGVLLSGVPGAGKSAFAAALGNGTGRKTLLMDMGKMRSKWTGESEGNIRAALQSVDAMQPCILLLDQLVA